MARGTGLTGSVSAEWDAPATCRRGVLPHPDAWRASCHDPQPAICGRNSVGSWRPPRALAMASTVPTVLRFASPFHAALRRHMVAQPPRTLPPRLRSPQHRRCAAGRRAGRPRAGHPWPPASRHCAGAPGHPSASTDAGFIGKLCHPLLGALQPARRPLRALRDSPAQWSSRQAVAGAGR